MVENKYYVLYERGSNIKESKKGSKCREVYGRIKKFNDLEKAANFAINNLSEEPVLFANPSLIDKFENQIKYKNKPYIIAGYFPTKNARVSFDEFSHYEPVYEVTRSSESGLEKAIKELGEESTTKIYVGIDLKLKGFLLSNSNYTK